MDNNCDSGFEYEEDEGDMDMDTDEDNDYYQEDVSVPLKREHVSHDYEILNAEQIYQNMVKTCEKVYLREERSLLLLIIKRLFIYLFIGQRHSGAAKRFHGASSS
jgi:glutathionylspermidine synthase